MALELETKEVSTRGSPYFPGAGVNELVQSKGQKMGKPSGKLGLVIKAMEQG